MLGIINSNVASAGVNIRLLESIVVHRTLVLVPSRPQTINIHSILC